MSGSLQLDGYFDHDFARRALLVVVETYLFDHDEPFVFFDLANVLLALDRYERTSEISLRTSDASTTDLIEDGIVIVLGHDDELTIVDARFHHTRMTILIQRRTATEAVAHRERTDPLAFGRFVVHAAVDNHGPRIVPFAVVHHNRLSFFDLSIDEDFAQFTAHVQGQIGECLARERERRRSSFCAEQEEEQG